MFSYFPNFAANIMMNNHSPQRRLDMVSLIPISCTKVVHFIRHAEGYHNVAASTNPNAYKSIAYFDCHLTSKGWNQIEKLKRQIREMGDKFKVDLVVCSPMTRTLETTAGIFGMNSPRFNNRNTKMNDKNQFQVLMHGHDELLKKNEKKFSRSKVVKSGFRPKHDTIYVEDGSPPIIAIEWCRERFANEHPCDKRRDISYYKQKFPYVSFDCIETNEDYMSQKESHELLTERTLKFLNWLQERPESNIVVVSHSGFLRNMCHLFGEDYGPILKNDLHRYFKHCEIRSLVLLDKNGSNNAMQLNKN